MRDVHPALQAHLEEPVTTTCRLLRIESQSGEVFGLTTLDVDLTYNDGDGAVTYVATQGFDPTAIKTDLGVSIDNAEGMALLSNEVAGITKEMVDSGEFDDAEWVCYLINFNDLTTGRHAILGSGDIGEVRTRYGMMWIPELLDLGVRLRQPIGCVTSRTCRAEYGLAATEANGQRGCGVDVTSLWTSGVVQSVGGEPDRVFTGDAVATLPDPDYPAMLQFLTGSNAGRTYSVENVTGLVVSLLETTHNAIQAGDTYRIRRDCAKRYSEDCITLNSNGPNFKGEPFQPDESDVKSQKL